MCNNLQSFSFALAKRPSAYFPEQLQFLKKYLFPVFVFIKAKGPASLLKQGLLLWLKLLAKSFNQGL